jgi:hypothetical protein
MKSRLVFDRIASRQPRAPPAPVPEAPREGGSVGQRAGERFLLVRIEPKAFPVRKPHERQVEDLAAGALRVLAPYLWLKFVIAGQQQPRHLRAEQPRKLPATVYQRSSQSACRSSRRSTTAQPWQSWRCAASPGARARRGHHGHAAGLSGPRATTHQCSRRAVPPTPPPATATARGMSL